MRVNVSKAFFSKTFICGLKVLLQRQLTESNKESWEFYLKLNCKFIKQKFRNTAIQLFIILIVITILTEFATFANLILLTIIQELIVIFISFNVFSRLTVLMNDLRLKTFHCNSINYSKFIKNSTTTTSESVKIKILSSKSNINLSRLRLTPHCASSSAEAAAAAAVVFETSAILSKQTTNNKNNHHRTYNNNSKSNKVFLYYTPRDPHLRIFLKTKHFFNRPQQQYQVNKSKSKNTICCTTTVANRILLKIFSDLCNYGELIGGGYDNQRKRGECVSGDNKTLSKQLNSAFLKTTRKNCDSLKEINDNLIVATTGAAIETNSANIFTVIVIVAVLSEYTKELVKSIGILLSFHYSQQLVRKSNAKSTIDLSERTV